MALCLYNSPSVNNTANIDLAGGAEGTAFIAVVQEY